METVEMGACGYSGNMDTEGIHVGTGGLLRHFQLTGLLDITHQKSRIICFIMGVGVLKTH